MQVIPASRLRFRVKLQHRPTTKDAAFNSDVPGEWTDLTVDPIWADVEDKPQEGSAENVVAGQRQFVRRSEVLIRYRDGVTNQMRVVWPERGRTLQVVGLQEVGRRAGLLLTCEEYAS